MRDEVARGRELPVGQEFLLSGSILFDMFNFVYDGRNIVRETVPTLLAGGSSSSGWASTRVRLANTEPQSIAK